jgi:hypothetical protein
MKMIERKPLCGISLFAAADSGSLRALRDAESKKNAACN